MLFIYLVFCLFLFAYQSSCSQISQESSDFDLNKPDLITSYEIDLKQFQIEAFKSTFNDKLIEKNQTGFHKQLKWVSLGNPMLIKTTQIIFFLFTLNKTFKTVLKLSENYDALKIETT